MLSSHSCHQTATATASAFNHLPPSSTPSPLLPPASELELHRINPSILLPDSPLTFSVHILAWPFPPHSTDLVLRPQKPSSQPGSSCPSAYSINSKPVLSLTPSSASRSLIGSCPGQTLPRRLRAKLIRGGVCRFWLVRHPALREDASKEQGEKTTSPRPVVVGGEKNPPSVMMLAQRNRGRSCC